VAARSSLLEAEKKATADSPLQAPVWLLPAALDLVAFMAMWTALSGGRSTPAPKPVAKPTSKRKAKRSSKPRVSKTDAARAQAEALFRREATNDNVVRFPSAS